MGSFPATERVSDCAPDRSLLNNELTAEHLSPDSRLLQVPQDFTPLLKLAVAAAPHLATTCLNGDSASVFFLKNKP